MNSETFDPMIAALLMRTSSVPPVMLETASAAFCIITQSETSILNAAILTLRAGISLTSASRTWRFFLSEAKATSLEAVLALRTSEKTTFDGLALSWSANSYYKALVSSPISSLVARTYSETTTTGNDVGRHFESWYFWY